MTVGKRENEKKRLAKREAKLKEKKVENLQKQFDDMIAYVDEYGMITSTPPEENIKSKRLM